MENLQITFVELDNETARRAHMHTSFHPEKRAEQHKASFKQTLESVLNKNKIFIKCEASKAAFIESFNEWQNQYKKHYENWLTKKGSCISAMITGPANFPTRRAERANIAEQKAGEFLFDWVKYSPTKWIANKVQAAYSTETKEKIRTEHINEYRSELARGVISGLKSSIEAVAGRSPYYPQLIKDAAARKIMNLAKAGFKDYAIELLNEYNQKCKEDCNKVIFTPRHKIWKQLESIEEVKRAKEEEKAQGITDLFSGEGYKVVNNHEAERVQILFDEKPDEETRTRLKRNGLKWSPRFGAWQRKNTYNGLRDVKRLFNQPLD